MKPKVSVIIPVFNLENLIGRTIESILQQDYKNFEIILVDDNSTDDTIRAIKKFKSKKIKLIRNKKNIGAGASRNIAIKKATGKFIAFTDGDCTVPKDWISNYIAVVEKKKAKILCGPVETPKDLNFLGRAVGVLGIPAPTLNHKGEAIDFPTCNAFIETSLLKKFEAFQKTATVKRAAETDLIARMRLAGNKIFHVPESFIYHHHRSTVTSFAKWRFKSGQGIFEISRKYFPKFKPMHFLFNFIPVIAFMVLLLGLKFYLEETLVIFGAYFLFRMIITSMRMPDFSNSELAFGVILKMISRVIASLGFYFAFIKWLFGGRS